MVVAGRVAKMRTSVWTSGPKGASRAAKTAASRARVAEQRASVMMPTAAPIVLF